jgi:antitoxin HicB
MYKYEIIITPNDKGGYYARIPDIPSIFTGGMSEEEALKNAREAINEYMKVCQEERFPVPKPKAYSGKFNVRVPRTLHRVLVAKAEEEGISLNQLIVSFLSSCSRSLVFQANPPMQRSRARKKEPFMVEHKR